MHWFDWSVLAVYVAIVLGFGWLASRRQKTAEDYYLGGRRMAWWAIGISILANSYSGASMIGQTGEGYAGGLAWLQTQLGDLLGFALVALLFLPFFSRLRLTSAYEYLERRFGVRARSLASILFIVQMLLRAGLLVYAPALLLATVLGISIEWAIVASAAVSILYCSMGGLVADVWTDVIQLAVVLLGLALSITFIAADVGGIDRVVEHARDTGKFSLGASPLEFDRARSDNLYWALLAYGSLALAIQGTNQQSVQRYMACTDLRAARRAAFLAWGIGVGTTALTVFFGIALASWTALVPGALGDPGAGGGASSDRVFLSFVATRLPAGMTGLMVAALLAAAMSSIDSAIQSLSTAVSVDFVGRFRKTPLSTRAELWLARSLTALFGVLALAIALAAARAQTGLLKTMVSWLGMIAGPLLGLFLLGLCSRRAREEHALIGAGCAVAWVALALALELPAPRRWNFHLMWLCPTSAALGFGVGWLLGRLARER